jgi:hypothetical protein
MFGGAQRITDPNLGELTRRGRSWKGLVAIGGGAMVPLVVGGGRSGPDPDAVAMIVTVVADYEQLRPLVRDALVEHRDDSSEPETSSVDVPNPVHITVIKFDGQPTVELGYQVDWDEEHTLGARVRNGVLLELSGSVPAP